MQTPHIGNKFLPSAISACLVAIGFLWPTNADIMVFGGLSCLLLALSTWLALISYRQGCRLFGTICIFAAAAIAFAIIVGRAYYEQNMY